MSPHRSFHVRSALARVAGPALIVASVLAVLHAFAFRSLLSTSDVLRYWMPTYCFTGRAVASGHVPGWNPYVMGGVPFAADPQSGWMYAPAMTLFAALPCGAAIRWTIVLLPIVAGLGLSAFLRAERLSRPAATTGGVVLALGIAGSGLSLSLPFSGMLAWTAATLACAARCVRAPPGWRRVLWTLAAAITWGQLAAAHFSVGLVMGSLAVVTYLVVAWRRDPASLGPIAWLLVAAPLVNLAFLAPRLAYLPGTSLGLGYARLQAIVDALGRRPAHPFPVGPAALPTWPLKFATSPGGHLGAVALVLALAAFWSSRHRPLAVGFAVFGAICYVLSLRRVASLVPNSLRGSRPAAFYLHDPQWFAYAAVLAVAVLAAIGLEAWMEARSARDRVAMAAPGVLVWLVLPFALGASLVEMALFLVGLVVGGVVLVLGPRRPAAVLAVPLVLAIELGVNGSIGPQRIPAFGDRPKTLGARSRPTVDPDDYLQPGPLLGIVARSGGGRALVVQAAAGPAPPVSTDRVVISNLTMLYGVDGVAAFNPVQALRYWILVRASQPGGSRLAYTWSQFLSAPPLDMDLFGVRWVIAAGGGRPPPPGLRAVATAGPWTLFRRSSAPSMASVVPRWAVVRPAQGGYPSAALDRVLAPGFDPEREVVLEERPTFRGPSTSPSASAVQARIRYTATGRESARIDGRFPRGIVLVRVPFDANWRATVDGRAVPILRADYLFQGIAVTAGRHSIVLRYDDRWIGYGVAGSAVVVLAMALLAAASALRDRRRSPT